MDYGLLNDMAVMCDIDHYVRAHRHVYKWKDLLVT